MAEFQGAKATVCLVQGMAKQYRKPFFDGLYEQLKDAGVCLRVVYSDPNPREARRGDNIDLPETYGRKVPRLWLANERLLFQPLFREIGQADLVIVDHANKYLMTYPLLLASRLGLKKVAFWGHGRNRQASPSGASEWLKRRLIGAVDWWFAYTDGVARYVADCGFPVDRITSVHNSVDLSAFREQLAGVGATELEALRQFLGILPGARVALYCGGLHADKRLAFFVDAAVAIRQRLPDFRLIVVGAGAEEGLIKSAAEKYEWLQYVGPKFGQGKAAYFHLAEVFLCPGLVGLGILDAFAAGLPLVTSDLPIHSPEIEYLENGKNGLVTACDPEAYAEAVVSLLQDRVALSTMQSEARTASGSYSLEQMVINFRDGVLACLNK